MRKTDLADLRQTVERLRDKLCPDLDAEFLDAVITAEDQNPEDDPEAVRQIQIALQATLARSGSR